MAPIDINNQEIDSITLNGNTEIDTVEVNGQEVFSSGPEVFIVDDFNDGSFDSAWQGARNTFTVQSGTVFEGSHALQDTTSFNNFGGRLYYDEGVFTPGTTLAWWSRGDFHRLYFGFDGNADPIYDSAYSVKCYQKSQSMDISDNDTGDSVNSRGGPTGGTGSWRRSVLEYTSATDITYRIFKPNGSQDGPTLNLTTGNHTGSSFAIQNRDVTFDQFKVVDPDNLQF